MSGDNISHVPFSIWRLPRLLRFCKTKLANYRDVHKIFIPKYSFQNICMSKQNFSMTNKNFYVKKKKFLWPTKISMSKHFLYVQPKNPTSNIKNHITTKIFHTYTHKNFHTHQIGLTHSIKFSHSSKMNLFNQAYTSNFHDFNTLKIHSSIPQVTYIAQISRVINIVQISPCQITQQFKNAPRPRLEHDHKNFQLNHTMSKISTRENNNKMTMSQYQVLN